MINVETDYLDNLTEGIYNLLNGKEVNCEPLPDDYPDNELKQLYTYFMKWRDYNQEMTEYIYSISRGELNVSAPKSKIKMNHSLKNLQANLKHLTWATQQIAEGDFNHKVDFIGDFSEAFNDMTRQLKEAFERIQEQNVQLLDANEIIQKDKEKIDDLLHNILPAKVIVELEETGRSTPKVYDNVTVFFSDIVGFTDKAQSIDPVILIDELNGMFTAFDKIVEKTQGERIKTIGDAFMATWGLHTPLEDHAEKAVEASLEILEFLKKRNENWHLKWKIRVGLHTGTVVGGVVGETKFIYDIFGDTVNTASRMESNSEPMRINISEDVFQLVKDKYRTSDRGAIFAKGMGETRMYFIDEEIHERGH